MILGVGRVIIKTITINLVGNTMSYDSDFDSNNNQKKQLTAEQRLERIENVVLSQNQSNQNATYIGKYGDEIDVKELLSVIWAGKLKIILITTIFSVMGVIYVLLLPNIYKATTVLAPTSQESQSGLGGLASQYSGLAAMAGINLGGGSGDNKIEHAIELLKSWPYIEGFVEKYDLKSTFMATKGWNENSNTLIIDDDIYDEENKVWLHDDSESLEPSSYETYEEVSKLISIVKDDKSGLIKLSVKHYSPHIAKKVVDLLTAELNEYFKQLDQNEAMKSIEVLSRKIQETNNNDMQQVFYNMIEAHSKTLLMTEVNEQYLIKTVVPVMLPEKKDGPKRALICAFAFMLGLLFSSSYLVVRHFTKND